MKKLIYLFALMVIVSACGTTSNLPSKISTYSMLYNEKPSTILVLPPINNSNKVDAKELFYSSLNVPFTQKGYYVIPPLLAMEILKEESAYDTEMFMNNSMKKVGTLFGVDAVLFTTIHKWSKSSIGGQINVKIEYKLQSTKTDSTLFNRIGDVTVAPQTNSGNIWADLVTDMLLTALTKEISVGRTCNYFTLSDIPASKYHPEFEKDSINPSQPKEFIKVLETTEY